MAERRMFAKSIISSGRFLRMPPSSRLLYYDLGMYADDDGVVEAFSVMRQTQATEDDLRVLVSKGFVRILNDELVAHITDWKVNNFIRNDRYHPSIYTDLLLQLTDGSTDGIPTVNQRDTEVSIGKVSIGKDSIDNYSSDDGKKKSRFVPPTVGEVSAYINEKGYHVDAEQFIDFYESKGWMVGRNKMKDWKACVRTWERNNQNNTRGETKKSGNPFLDMLREGNY